MTLNLQTVTYLSFVAKLLLSTFYPYYIQWNLRITDTFGTHCFLAILSSVERLSFLMEVKSVLKKVSIWYIETCPLFGGYFYCVPYLEGVSFIAVSLSSSVQGGLGGGLLGMWMESLFLSL